MATNIDFAREILPVTVFEAPGVQALSGVEVNGGRADAHSIGLRLNSLREEFIGGSRRGSALGQAVARGGANCIGQSLAVCGLAFLIPGVEPIFSKVYDHSKAIVDIGDEQSVLLVDGFYGTFTILDIHPRNSSNRRTPLETDIDFHRDNRGVSVWVQGTAENHKIKRTNRPSRNHRLDEKEYTARFSSSGKSIVRIASAYDDYYSNLPKVGSRRAARRAMSRNNRRYIPYRR